MSDEPEPIYIPGIPTLTPAEEAMWAKLYWVFVGALALVVVAVIASAVW